MKARKSVLTLLLVLLPALSTCTVADLPDPGRFDSGSKGEGEGESEGEGENEVVWYGSMSKLSWQDPPPSEEYTWQGAIDYCDNLTWGGHSDWRLPTISELRSLIRGCPDTMTGGACGVTDSCRSRDCWADDCEGCERFQGPGQDGCYWDASLHGNCDWFWSSSPDVIDGYYAWRVYFFNGNVLYGGKTYTYYVRCVRSGP